MNIIENSDKNICSNIINRTPYNSNTMQLHDN